MVRHITTTQEYDELIKSGTVLVDFYATWCGPCQMLAPLLEEIDEENEDVTVLKVNVDENYELAARYGIQSIPNLYLFKDGKLVDTRLGYQNKNQLLKFIGK